MHLIVLLVLMSSVAGAGLGANKVVRSANDQMVCLTNERVEWAEDRLVLLGADGTRVFHWDSAETKASRNGLFGGDIDWTRLWGHQGWGVVDDSVFYVYSLPSSPLEINVNGPNIDCVPTPIEDVLAIESLDDVKQIDQMKALARGMFEFGQDYGCRIHPLGEYIGVHHKALSEKWNLWIDVVYTTLDTCIVVGVREGKLMVWKLNGTGNPMRGEWSTEVVAPTTLNRPFRILRAGTELSNFYLIDEAGIIYTGFGADHKVVGVVEGFQTDDDEVITLLFEDQKTRTIGILHAGPDGALSVLQVEWQDDSHAPNFLTEIESDELRNRLKQVEVIVREDLHDAHGE